MNIGIGLPAAVPGVDGASIAIWAREAEEAGFASVGVIDRLVYDNLEPLTTLGAAAAATTRVELLTTVLNAGWRANPVLLAKQLASVDVLSGSRLTAGIGLGGWPEDFAASDVAATALGKLLDSTITTMRQVWAGEIAGQGGPTRRLPEGRPILLFGGLVPAAFNRAATQGAGWVAPLFGFELLKTGAAAVRDLWQEAGRTGAPRIVTGRYVSFGGPDAMQQAEHYLAHYYGADQAHHALADTPTTPDALAAELDRLATTGVTDVVLYPCTAEVAELHRIADAVGIRLSTPESVEAQS